LGLRFSQPDGSVGMALVLPALTNCRWWFESLLVHSGISSATRRKATGADHKKITRSRKMGPSRSPSYFWDRMHSSVKEQKGKDFHGPILGPGGNHKIVKMQQRLTLQTKKGHSFKRSEVQPRKNCDLHPFVSRGKWDAFFIQSCS